MTTLLPDWDFAKLEELIEARGDEVIVETGVACPCRREDSLGSNVELERQPATLRRINCNRCQGDGYIYRNARCIKGLLTSIQAGPNKKLIEAGYANPGDAVFSPSLKAEPIGDFDRITFTRSDFIGEGQIILRNAGQIEDNASRRTDLSSTEDRLWYQADCAIWCEGEDGVIYAQDTDFVLEDKKIRWVGNKPDDNTFYTLKYTAYLEWIAYNTPMARVDAARSLSQKVLIRKKHVAFHGGSFAGTPAKRQEEQETLTTRIKL